jgi:hypothetical protein
MRDAPTNWKSSTTIPMSDNAKVKTLMELGKILVETVGKTECALAYRINADDLVEVGRQALLHGDINRDGTFN